MGTSKSDSALDNPDRAPDSAIAGDRGDEVAEPSIRFDRATDILTFEGYQFAGELMRTFTETPCGRMFRIVKRENGAITVSQEEHPLAVAAPDMQAALLNVQKLISEAAMTGFNWKDGDWAERLFASQQVTSSALAKARGA